MLLHFIQAGVMVIETMLGLAESLGGSIWFVYHEGIPTPAVVGHRMFVLDTRQGEDIHNAIWVKPNSSIAPNIANEVGPCHPSSGMDVHVVLCMTDILEEVVIHKDINSGLTI